MVVYLRSKEGRIKLQYNFDTVIERRGTNSIKYDHQDAFGTKEGLLPFWIADSDWGTMPEIMQAIRQRAEFPIFGYTNDDIPSAEATRLWYKTRHGWDVPLDALVPSVSVLTSLCMVMEAVTMPGDKILVFTPVYDPFFRLVENNGRQLVRCPLIHKEDTYTIDFALLEKELQQGVKAIIFCNPHNPVGRVWTQQEMRTLAALCEQYNTYLLSDEIHGDITLFGNQYFTAGRLENIQDKVVVFTAISKTFNMAGLVSSCMFIPHQPLRQQVKDVMGRLFIYGPSDIAPPVITAAYTQGHAWVDAQNQYLSENAKAVQAYFGAHLPQVKLTRIEGTYLMWLDFACLGMNSKELCRLFAQKYQLALGIGRNYGNEGGGFMRLNIACPRSTLEEGLARLGQMYKDQMG